MTSYEQDVINKLDQILQNQVDIIERLDELEEKLANVSTPGGDYSVYDSD